MCTYKLATSVCDSMYGELNCIEGAEATVRYIYIFDRRAIIITIISNKQTNASVSMAA